MPKLVSVQVTLVHISFTNSNYQQGSKVLFTFVPNKQFGQLTTSKRVVKKTAEATGDLIGNKIDDQSISAGKTKSKEKEDERNKWQEIYIRPEKKSNWKKTAKKKKKKLRLFYRTSESVPRFITKILIEVYDQSGSVENRYKPSKQILFKISMLETDWYDYSDAYIVVKGSINVTEPNNDG